MVTSLYCAAVRRKYVVIAQGKEHRVEVHETEAGLTRVSIDGREQVWDAKRSEGMENAVWSLLREGRASAATVSGTPTKLAIQLREIALDVSVLDQDRYLVVRSNKAVSDTNGVQVLRASIPGRVTRCLVKQGDAVEVGQGLIIIEAMKMENELRSERRGRVRELAVREGQSVESGETLVVIEP